MRLEALDKATASAEVGLTGGPAMTYEQLIQLQGIAAIVCLLAIAIGAVHLIAGLIKPAWVRRRGRAGVVLVSLAICLFGVISYAGTIGYTHSQPEGPHSLHRYLDDYFAEQCAQGADIPACKTAPQSGAASAP